MPSLASLRSLVVVCLVAAAVTPVLGVKGPKPDPCRAARYFVTGDPLVADVTGPVTSTLAVGSSIAIDDLCGAVTAKRFQANHKGVTQIVAKWTSCKGFTGAVHLKGRITPDCTLLTGTIKARKYRRRVEARISSCGDGILDEGGGEQCDDGNDAPGDGCEADCTETPSASSTTIATTSTLATTTSTPAATSSSTTLVATTTSTSSTLPVTTTTVPTSTTTLATTTTTSTSQPVTTTTASTTSTTGAVTTSTQVVATTTSLPPSTTSSTSTTLPFHDLGLVMIASPDPVGRNEILNYEVTVTNLGNVAATDVHVRLPVPSGVAGCRSASDGGVFPVNCVIGQNVSWSLGTLLPGASHVVRVSFLTTSSAVTLPDGAVVHATAQASEAFGTQENAQADVTVQEGAPLMLALTEDIDPVAIGETVEYVLRFGNRGLATQQATQLSVTLPPGLTVVDAHGGAIANDTVTWDLVDLLPNQVGERRLAVAVTGFGASDSFVRVAHAVLASTAASARETIATTLDAAPLGLVLRATPNPVGRGEVVTYELTVTNRRDVPTDVQAFIPVPPETAACQSVSDGGTAPVNCVIAQDVTWNLGSIPPGGSRTVVASFRVVGGTVPADGTIIPATARASDADGGAARASVSTPVEQTAPLMLALDEDVDPVAVGRTIEYTLRFGNRSLITQQSTHLTVALPPGLAIVDAHGGSVAGTTVEWDLGDLTPAQVGERRLAVEVVGLGAADRSVRVTRAELVSATEAARASGATTLDAAPLGLVMVATPNPLGRNEIAAYELTVTNHRGVAAGDVQVRLPVPPGMAGCEEVSDGGLFPVNCVVAQDVTWGLGQIPAGGSRTVRVAFRVASGGGTPADGTIIPATARVRDVAAGFARAGASTAVQQTSALMLGLAEDVDPVAAGQALEYVLKFGNRSAITQLSTHLTVTLAPGLGIVDADGGTIGGRTVDWDLGDLTPNQVGERRLAVTVVGLQDDPLVRVTRAVLESTTAAARETVATALDAAPLGLVMVATPDPVGRSEVLTYELTVTNHRAVAASDVMLRMPVPPGLAACQGVSDAGTFPVNCIVSHDVAWNLGQIPANGSRVVVVTFVTASGPADGTILPATARVSDVAGGAARACASTPVVENAPLMLGLVEDADPVTAGQTVEYVLRFGNRDVAPHATATLTATLPPGMTPVDVHGGTVDGSVVTWSLGDLAAGQSGERRLSATVDALGAGDPLVRVTRAVFASGDAAAYERVATAIDAAPLGLTMTATPDPVGRGTALTYSLTITNHRNVAASDVVLAVPVPPGPVTCQTASDGGAFPVNCLVGRDVTWSLGQLAIGAVKTVQVTFVTASASGLPRNGTVIPATGRVRDTAGGAARTGRSVVVD